MNIAVNTRILLPDYLDGYGRFLFEILKRITRVHSEHSFILLFDRPVDPNFVWSENCKAVVAGPRSRYPILWKWWYDVRVPALLKKYKADVFVSGDGSCSLQTKIPQCMVVQDLAYLHVPEGITKSHHTYLKRNTPKFLEKANRIITVSDFIKKDIAGHFTVPENKMDLIYYGVNENFRTATDEEKTAVRNKFTNGMEYFLYAGSLHPRKNLINLLRAFSIFKKKQHSAMKLVLAGRMVWEKDGFMEKLKNYKYRDDVILTGYLPEPDWIRLMAGAYAFVYPSVWEGFGVQVLEAMRSGVPVITSIQSAMQEITQDAALYADPKEPSSIAEKMIRIYKDENLRKRLIAEGLVVQAKYSWDKAADLFWVSIEKTMSETVN